MPSARAITRSSWSAFSNARLAADDVDDRRGALVGHAQPHGALALVLAAEAAVAVGLLERAHLVGAGGGAVGVAAGEQALDDLGVAVGAARLEHGLAVVVDPEPPERLEDLLDVLGRGALAVGVLDPQHELGGHGRGPGASCRARCGRRRCAGRRSARVRSGRAWAGEHARTAVAMLIGAHVSPSGGPAKAVERGAELGAPAIQIFNQNPRQWKPRAYADEEFAAYHEALRRDATRRRGGCADPRRLPAQLRLRGPRDPREVATRR